MAEQSTFARRMMAQKLMTEKRDDPFSDSRFFNSRALPNSAVLQMPDIIDTQISPESVDIGAALLGQDNIQDRGTILPVGRSPEGDIVPAFPEFITSSARGLRDAATTVGRAMQGDPRYIPVDGKLPDDVVDEITNFGLTFGGAGMTGANLLRGSIPEGALGIFAGQRASSFPGAKVANEKGQEILKEQNRLMGEYKYVTNELTKGRMQLGDDVADELRNRADSLANRMNENTSQLGKLEDEGLEALEKQFAASDEQTFFNLTDRELGKGLFKLPDNQFRFEIDDRSAKIRLAIGDDEAALTRGGLETVLEKALPATDNIQVGSRMRLDSLLDHDELFEAYPQLRGYGVRIKFDANDEARGSFRPSEKLITVNLGDMRPFRPGVEVLGKSLKKDIKSTLVHEIQHAVQEIEGFARGSNTRVANADVAVARAVTDKRNIVMETQAANTAYRQARAELVNFAGAERIKYYEQKSLLDSHQPRLLFNQSNWYKYGDDIRRELESELGYSYNKRKSPKRELWLSAAFAKLALKERGAMPAAARLADASTMKEIKSKVGKLQRLSDKNFEDAARYRNAYTSLEQIQGSNRYQDANPEKLYNIYSDSLGEAEARAVQARAEPATTADFSRSLFPPNQFQEGGMTNAPPFGLQNTLRQQGGFFKD
jgi:hypothetical protein